MEPERRSKKKTEKREKEKEGIMLPRNIARKAVYMVMAL